MTSLAQQVLSSANYLKRITNSPITARKLQKLAPRILAVEQAAWHAQKLLEDLERDAAVRQPYPKFDEVKKRLADALG